jgi:hypothetical protein
MHLVGYLYEDVFCYHSFDVGCSLIEIFAFKDNTRYLFVVYKIRKGSLNVNN